MNHIDVTSSDEVQLDDPIVYIPQLAKMLGDIPAATVRYWDFAGTGPRSFKIGKRRAYRLSEINRWLAEQERTTAGGARSAAQTE